jgi:uncharacterized membrane protein YkoI
MRKPLFVAVATGATLLVGGAAAAAIAGGPVDGTRAAVTRATDSPTANPTHQSTIAREQAKTVALRQTGGGKVVSTELELEHGRLVWKVLVVRGSAEWRVDVDASSGEVTRVRAERGDRGAARDDDRRGRGNDDGQRAARDDRGFDDHGVDRHANDNGQRHGGDDHAEDQTDDHGGNRGPGGGGGADDGDHSGHGGHGDD